MNVLEIRRTIAAIAKSDDDETQHFDEDQLLVDVLKAIAAGADNPRELASEVLEVRKLIFARWYA